MKLIEIEYVSEWLPKGWLPYYIYEIQVDNKVVGKITLRTGNIHERYYDGHVGYHIDVEFRGKRYGYQALLLVGKIACEKGFKELILTCDPNNIYSKRIIEKVANHIETKIIPKEQKRNFTKEEVIKDIYIWNL